MTAEHVLKVRVGQVRDERWLVSTLRGQMGDIGDALKAVDDTAAVIKSRFVANYLSGREQALLNSQSGLEASLAGLYPAVVADLSSWLVARDVQRFPDVGVRHWAAFVPAIHRLETGAL